MGGDRPKAPPPPLPPPRSPHAPSCPCCTAPLYTSHLPHPTHLPLPCFVAPEEEFDVGEFLEGVRGAIEQTVEHFGERVRTTAGAGAAGVREAGCRGRAQAGASGRGRGCVCKRRCDAVRRRAGEPAPNYRPPVQPSAPPLSPPPPPHAPHPQGLGRPGGHGECALPGADAAVTRGAAAREQPQGARRGAARRGGRGGGGRGAEQSAAARRAATRATAQAAALAHARRPSQLAAPSPSWPCRPTHIPTHTRTFPTSGPPCLARLLPLPPRAPRPPPGHPHHVHGARRRRARDVRVAAALRGRL